jgi:hypothetical protein
MSDWYDDMEDDYAQAEKKDKFTQVPDGNYSVRVDEAKLKKTDSDITYLSWKLVVIAGQLTKRIIFKNDYFDKGSPYIQDKLSYLKTDLDICGLTLNSLSELRGRLDDLLDINLEVTVKSKPNNKGGTFTNVYINRKLGDDIDGDSYPDTSVLDDDIPF